SFVSSFEWPAKSRTDPRPSDPHPRASESALVPRAGVPPAGDPRAGGPGLGIRRNRNLRTTYVEAVRESGKRVGRDRAHGTPGKASRLHDGWARDQSERLVFDVEDPGIVLLLEECSVNRDGKEF